VKLQNCNPSLLLQKVPPIVSWSLYCKVQKLELVPILLYKEGMNLFF
jgi:hypothetical protein